MLKRTKTQWEYESQLTPEFIPQTESGKLNPITQSEDTGSPTMNLWNHTNSQKNSGPNVGK